MRFKKPSINKRIIIFFLYVLIVGICFFNFEKQYNDLLTCCGLYEGHNRFYLPFPVIKDFRFLDLNRGGVDFLWINMFFNLLIASTVFVLAFIGFDKVKDFFNNKNS